MLDRSVCMVSYTIDRLTATTGIGTTQAAGIRIWQGRMAICHKLNRICNKPLRSRGRGKIRPPGTSDSLPRSICVAHSDITRPRAWGLLLHSCLVSKCIGPHPTRASCGTPTRCKAAGWNTPIAIAVRVLLSFVRLIQSMGSTY